MKRYKLVKKYPTLAEDWKIGMEVGLGDRICKYSPCNSIYTDQKLSNKEVENYPEFWEEIIEYDFEVISFIRQGVTTRFNEPFDMNLLDGYLYRNYEIYSVKRLSDSEVFTVGDLVSLTSKIASLQVHPDKALWVNFEACHGRCGSWGGIQDVEKLVKYKEPLFITEDGVNKNTNDRYWYVVEYNPEILKHAWKPMMHIVDWTSPVKPPLGKIQFHLKENAEKYIEENEPRFSKKQMLDFAIDTAHMNYLRCKSPLEVFNNWQLKYGNK